jgi:SAM-dependent methyltransferase
MHDDEMLTYYRHRAPEYEQIYYRDNPARRQEIREEEDRLRKLVTSKSVLELACGTGYWTRVMAETASSITAMDISPEMVEEARKKEYGIPVNIQVADMYKQQFEPGQYDVIALGFWFSHHPRHRFNELFDLLECPLKPGGAIWMVDNNPPAEGPSNESVRVDEYGNNFKRRYLNSGREFVILKNYFSRRELEKLFSERYFVLNLAYGRFYWSAALRSRR